VQGAEAVWVRLLLALRSRFLLSRRERFLAAYDLDPDRLIEATARRFETNRPYTSHYVHQLVRHHRDNALLLLYLESELGALRRARYFLRMLSGLLGSPNPFAGKRCLDVGANAGHTLLAFCERGASLAVGVEIEKARYETALLNLRGEPEGVRSRLQIHHGDILDTRLAAGLPRFDVIFCLDVIEHVADARDLVHNLSTLLSDSPGAFIYIKVGNPHCPQNVLAEPHHRIPGLVLLPRELAGRFYEATRTNPDMPYGVETWRSFFEYRDLFEERGLRSRAPEEAHISEADIERFYRMTEPVLPQFQEFCAAKNVPAGLREEAETHVRAYLAEVRDVFERYRATRDPALDSHIWLKYWPADVEMVVTRA